MEFQNLGNHCSEPTCKQIDFLPFTCKFCEKKYCLDHRDSTSHACPKANMGNAQVFICPVCSKSVRFDSGAVNADEYWSIHAATECQPNNDRHNKAPKTKVCDAAGCKAQLTSVNTHMCKKCKQELCLKHRFEDQHECGWAPYPKNRNFGLFEQKAPESRPAAPVNQRPVSNMNVVQETCTECGQKFPNLEALIMHAEKAHC